jgi:hypothetical protein
MKILNRKEMTPFQEAQNLFREYQKAGNLKKLQKSLEILEELIDEHSPEYEKTIRLKNAIRIRVESEISQILDRGNIPDFWDKYIKSDDNPDDRIEKLGHLLDASLSESDVHKAIALFRIRGGFLKE